MIDRAKSIDKIKKCMRLSKSSNPHEAAAALRQAQKLMAEHAITEGDIAASEAEAAQAKSNSSSKPTLWEVSLAKMIAGVFGCDIIFSEVINAQWTREGRYNFIGVGAQAQIASYAFTALRRQAAKARSDYTRAALKRCSYSAKLKRADQFSTGWVAAVRALAVKLARTDRTNEIIAAYCAMHYPNTSSVVARSRQATPLAYRDRQSGWEEGKKAQLHAGVGAAAPAGLLT